MMEKEVITALEEAWGEFCQIVGCMGPAARDDPENSAYEPGREEEAAASRELKIRATAALRKLRAIIVAAKKGGE